LKESAGEVASLGGAVLAATPRRRAIRPAATLILLDESSASPRIMMGRRSPKLVFMPGKYVFPGGRMESSDLRLARDFRLSGDAEDRLLAATASGFDARQAVGLALTAIRETFEEVGAMLGTPGALGGRHPGWSRFAEAGIVPDPANLIPVARAITPPGMPRRYDTRFFCVSATSIVSTLPFDQRPDPEFDSIGWFSLDEMAALDLPAITRQVLSDIEGRLRDGSWRDGSRAMPFYRFLRGRSVREMI
jgi:8-oxo-dGTP pyrophosphatase MutT (NUDIX family)